MKAVWECVGCGAVAADKGRVLDNRCSCKDGDWRQLTILKTRMLGLDPDSAEATDYVQVVLRRLIADEEYLRLREAHGHQEAAAMVCGVYGHDKMGSICGRCNQRLDTLTDEQRRIRSRLEQRAEVFRQIRDEQ